MTTLLPRRTLLGGIALLVTGGLLATSCDGNALQEQLSREAPSTPAPLRQSEPQPAAGSPSGPAPSPQQAH